MLSSSLSSPLLSLSLPLPLPLQERFKNLSLLLLNKNDKDNNIQQSLDFSCENLTDNDAIAIASILCNNFIKRNKHRYYTHTNNYESINNNINNCTSTTNTVTTNTNTTTTNRANNDSTIATMTNLMSTNSSTNDSNTNTNTNTINNYVLKNLGVESINIDMNPFITTIGFNALCESFMYHNSITKVSIVNCNIDYNKSIILSNMILCKTTNIQILYLADNSTIDMNGIIHIINACTSNTTLQHLDIRETIHSYSTFSTTGSDCITSTDQQQQEHVEEKKQQQQQQQQQQTENKMMKKQLYTSFIQLLKTNTTLQQINLSKNGLDDTFIKHFSYGLQYNTTLTKLVLYNNNIGDDGAIYLSKVLLYSNSSSSAIRELYLSDNNIGNNGIQHIAYSLHYNTILKSLDISENNFTIDGIYCLLRCIEYNESLVHLDISGSSNTIPKEIRPTVCNDIIQSLQYNNTIRHLWLSGIDNDTIDTTLQQNYDQKRIACKKGQHRLHDTISWLLHNWCYQ